jgi:hypothetical protein
MIEKNDVLVLDGVQYLVTTVRDHSVYGVRLDSVDDSGTAGNELFLGPVEAFEN